MGHVFDVRAGWPLAQASEECVERSAAAFGDDFDTPAVGEIARVAGEAEITRGALDEPAETDALHAAVDFGGEAFHPV